MMSPDEFLDWIKPAAYKICPEYDLPACVCVAAAANESGWGKYTIGEFNLFGRKAVEGDNSITVPTQEFYDGGWTVIDAAFKLYDTLEDAIRDWCILLTEEPCYADALPCRDDYEAFCRAYGPIYATDPEYAEKLLQTIRACGLETC